MDEVNAQLRHHRQVIFERFGPEAQRRLARGRVTIIGCGGLGSSLAEQLARAGVGFLRLVDADRVELTNIHRQHMFTTADQGRFKVDAAAEAIGKIDPAVELECVGDMLTAANAADLIAGSDLVLDGLDRWDARAVLDAACMAAGVPWVFTGVSGSELMTMNIIPGESCCLACAIDPPVDDPPSAGGILGPSVWVASGLEATEAMKFFAGGPQAMRDTLLAMDVWTGRTRLITPPPPSPSCVCGQQGR